MFKKLLIAAVAVVAGLAVLNLSLVRVWYREACSKAKSLVPPEVRLKQLNSEIDNIDKDIKKNISRLARMEVEVKMFEEQLDAKRDRQAHLRSDISEMRKSLETARTEKVFYNGRKVDSSRLTSRLDMAVTEFTSLKEQVKVQEQLLGDKKRTLEAAHNRITEMKNEKEKLRLLATRLATHLELVKMKQLQNQEIAFDDSAISNAREIAKDVEIQLRTAEADMKLKSQFGYAEKSPLEKEGKSTEEVLKSAREALQDDARGDKVAAEVEVEK
jgi:chromosome segregation ATPase